MPTIRRCCIVGCFSNSRQQPQLQFFQFPRPENPFHKLWKQACHASLGRILPFKKPVVCALHFHPQCIGGRRLTASAVPSLNLEVPSNLKDVEQQAMVEEIERSRKCAYINAVVYEWLVRANLNPQLRGSITHGMIKEKADSAKQLIGSSSFVPDNRWLNRFRETHLRGFAQKLATNQLKPLGNSLWIPDIVQDLQHLFPPTSQMSNFENVPEQYINYMQQYGEYEEDDDSSKDSSYSNHYQQQQQQQQQQQMHHHHQQQQQQMHHHHQQQQQQQHQQQYNQYGHYDPGYAQAPPIPTSYNFDEFCYERQNMHNAHISRGSPVTLQQPQRTASSHSSLSPPLPLAPPRQSPLQRASPYDRGLKLKWHNMDEDDAAAAVGIKRERLDADKIEDLTQEPDDDDDDCNNGENENDDKRNNNENGDSLQEQPMVNGHNSADPQEEEEDEKQQQMDESPSNGRRSVESICSGENSNSHSDSNHARNNNNNINGDSNITKTNGRSPTPSSNDGTKARACDTPKHLNGNAQIKQETMDEPASPTQASATATPALPYKDIETYAEALEYLKPLEEFVLFKENFRAIGLISQLEMILRKNDRVPREQTKTPMNE